MLSIRILPVILIQTWLGASECTHTRYRIKTSLQYVYLYNLPRLGGKWRVSFIIGQYHFKNSLAVAFKFCLLCELCVFACWAYFYCRIAGWNKSFGRVTWESKYDVGRPETCKDPKNITDEAILCTFLKVFDYIYIYIYIYIFSFKKKPKSS